jgi:hypothetical protein
LRFFAARKQERSWLVGVIREALNPLWNISEHGAEGDDEPGTGPYDHED